MMALTIILTILILSSIPAMSEAGFAYINNSAGITQFPHGLPPDTWKIVLKINQLTEIDYIEDYPLRELILNYNDIGPDLPDLAPVGPTLQKLLLENNQIQYITPSRLEALEVLQWLELDNCPLASIPDVSAGLGPGATLTNLDLEGTDITEFPFIQNLGGAVLHLDVSYTAISDVPIDRVNMLPNLDLLSIHHLPNLQILPNFCDLQKPLRVELWNAALVCDDLTITWARMAQVTGRVTFEGGTDPACASPPAMAGQILTDPSIVTSVGSGLSRAALYSPVPDLTALGCYPDVSPPISVHNGEECAIRCLGMRGAGCVMYSVDDITGQCVLSQMGVGNLTSLNVYSNWYMEGTII